MLLTQICSSEYTGPVQEHDWQRQQMKGIGRQLHSDTPEVGSSRKSTLGLVISATPTFVRLACSTSVAEPHVSRQTL